MSDQTVPDSEDPRWAKIRTLTADVHLEDDYHVELEVETGSAIVTLPTKTRTEVVVLTTHGDLIASIIGAAEQARDDALADRTIPLVGKTHFAAEEVVQIAFEAAGAGTAPLLSDHPDYVFPSERVKDGVDRVLAERGLLAHGDGTVDRIVPPR